MLGKNGTAKAIAIFNILTFLGSAPLSILSILGFGPVAPSAVGVSICVIVLFSGCYCTYTSTAFAFFSCRIRLFIYPVSIFVVALFRVSIFQQTLPWITNEMNLLTIEYFKALVWIVWLVANMFFSFKYLKVYTYIIK